MPVRTPLASRLRGPHREHTAAKSEPTPKTHPQLFTAKGERKWKVPPAGAKVVKNTTGEGTWIEKWEAPKKKGDTGPVKWVHNYTLAEVQRRAGQKFTENREFAQKLPAIRAEVQKDLQGPPGEKQLAAMALTLIDKLCLRVGGEESADRDHFGATTLQKRHVSVKGDEVRLEFEGKSGVDWNVSLKDAEYAKRMKAQLAKVKGAEEPVFQHGGKPLRDEDVNQYLEPFGATAKKFRTFHATRLAREDLLAHAKGPPAERDKVVGEMFERVSRRLGHTPGVCRESYVDPMVVQAFLKGKLA